MGTRADFYVGRGKDADYLGSIAWDGYPEGIDPIILRAKTEHSFRAYVRAYITSREDGSLPERDGWPWPWGDSRLTDYAYSFDTRTNHVFVNHFGRGWCGCLDALSSEAYANLPSGRSEFPRMDPSTATFGKRSGLTIFKGGRK